MKSSTIVFHIILRANCFFNIFKNILNIFLLHHECLYIPLDARNINIDVQFCRCIRNKIIMGIIFVRSRFIIASSGTI